MSHASRSDSVRLKRGADALQALVDDGRLPESVLLPSAAPAVAQAAFATAEVVTIPVAALIPPLSPPLSELLSEVNPPNDTDLDALLGDDDFASSLVQLLPHSSPLPARSAPSAAVFVSLAQPGMCASCSGPSAKNCTLLSCQRCCVAQLGYCYIYRHQQVKMTSNAIYDGFRRKISAALAKPEPGRPVLYIMYQGEKDSEPRCRPILPVRWWAPDRGYKSFIPESAVIAKCLQNPTDATEKHFKVLRMSRVELAPFN